MLHALTRHRAAFSYAVWNPLDKAPSVVIGTVAAGSIASQPGGGATFSSVRATAAFSIKTYIELQQTNEDAGATNSCGVLDAAFSLAGNTYSGITALGLHAWMPNGNVFNNATLTGTLTSGATDPVVYGVCCDPSTRKVWMNIGGGAWLGGGNPALGTIPTCTLGGTGLIYPSATPFASGYTIILVSDPANMIGSPPSGFTAGL